ncbi:MAG TPA: hypothetical protein VE986_04260, partial [Hyphomicrobiales bacterium]|nr:hypothetical protein [Hyphomicrobiales bacterium]
IAATILLNQNAFACYYGDSCLEIQDRINLIYKRNGYCFQLPEWAERYGGNAGCIFNDQSRVPLSLADRQCLDWLVRLRAKLGCSF